MFIKKVREFLFGKKQPKQTLTTTKKEEILAKLRDLHRLLLYIDSQLPNRKAKRQFWRDFFKYGKVRNNVLANLIKNFK